MDIYIAQTHPQGMTYMLAFEGCGILTSGSGEEKVESVLITNVSVLSSFLEGVFCSLYNGTESTMDFLRDY